jgi:hypothetical protein
MNMGSLIESHVAMSFFGEEARSPYPKFIWKASLISCAVPRFTQMKCMGEVPEEAPEEAP